MQKTLTVGHQLSDAMKQRILAPFAQGTSLAANIAYGIFDSFAVEVYHKIWYFISINEKMQKIQQQQFQQVDQAQLLNMFNRVSDELDQSGNELLDLLKEFYLRERLACINCLLSLYNMSSDQKCPAFLYSFVQEKLLKKQLGQMLAAGLLRTLNYYDSEFGRFTESGDSIKLKEMLAEQIQTETLEVLKLLFALSYQEGNKKPGSQSSQAVSKDCVKMYVQYFIKSLQTDMIPPGLMMSGGLQSNYYVKQELIENFKLITALTMLGLGKQSLQEELVVSPGETSWSLLMDIDQFCPFQAPISLACVQFAQNAKKDFPNKKEIVERIQQSHIIQSASDLLKSQLFTLDYLQMMRIGFYKVIFGWFSLAHSFFLSQQMEEEVEDIRQISLDVVRGGDIVSMIWQFIDDKNLDQISMFKQALEAPLSDPAWFLDLAESLCGRKQSPRAFQVLNMLDSQKSQQGASLLSELMVWCGIQLKKLEDQLLDEKEVFQVLRMLIIFAKILKQNPLTYDILNNQYMSMAEDYQDGKLNAGLFESKGHASRMRNVNLKSQREYSLDVEIERGEQPFLQFLVLAIHSLMSLDYKVVIRPIKHLLDAVASIYDISSDTIKIEIINIFASYGRTNQGNYHIVQYVSNVIMNNEADLRSYRGTEAFLRFLCKIFKSNFPQECLTFDQRLAFDQSFIMNALSCTFQPLMEQYFSLEHNSLGSFGSLSSRALKLTNLLLKHFTDVPMSQKAPLLEPLPKFDFILQLIVLILNNCKVDQICIKTLELVSIDLDLVSSSSSASNLTAKSKLMNKYLHTAQKSGILGPNQLKKLCQAITHAIQVLNTLLRLISADDIKQRSPEKSSNTPSSIDQNSNSHQFHDWTSKRISYSHKLNCLHALRSLVLDPSAQQQINVYNDSGLSLMMSLSCQIGHYASLHSKLDYPQMRSSALDHLTLSVLLWEKNCTEKQRPDLYHLLQDLGSAQLLQEDFSQSLLKAIEEACEKPQILLSYLDLLIKCAKTQPRFIELVLKGSERYQNMSYQVKCIYEAFARLISGRIVENKDITFYEQTALTMSKFQFTILLSLMSKKGLCNEFINFKNGFFLKTIYREVIEKQCLSNLDRKFNFDGNYLKPYHMSDQNFDESEQLFKDSVRIQTMNMYQKVVICHYLTLLGSMYTRNPTHSVVRELVTKVFDNQKIKNLAIDLEKSGGNTHKLNEKIHAINEVIGTQTEERNVEYQIKIHQMILGMNFVSEKQIRECPLFSREDGVILRGLQGIDLFKNVQNLIPADLIAFGENYDCMDVFRSPGSLGCQFSINVDEIEVTLLTEFYKNKLFITQVKTLCCELNLAFSNSIVDHFVLRAKSNFITQIGKTTLKENQLQTSAQLLQASSLLPLVTEDKLYPKQKQEMHEISLKLIKVMINYAQEIYNELNKRISKWDLLIKQGACDKNFLSQQSQQDLVDHLVLIFGVIASQITCIGTNLSMCKAMTRNLLTSEFLFSLDKLVDLEGQTFGDGLVLDDSTAGRHNTAMSQKHRFELYAQLACFSLTIIQVVNINDLNQQQRPSGFSQVSHSLEESFVRILAKIISGMQKYRSFEIGLKVFNLIIQLTEEGHQQSLLQSVMRKQSNQPLKILISRLRESGIAEQEVSAILQLFTNYAQSFDGASHLAQTEIIESLSSPALIQKLSQQDLYMTMATGNGAGAQQKRNPLHIQWCQVLLLIRTMNDSLLDDQPQDGSQDHFHGQIRLVQMFKHRIQAVFNIGNQMDQSQSKQGGSGGIEVSHKTLSLALLEEIELLTAILMQLFEHSDLWALIDVKSFADIKDSVIFGLSKLLKLVDSMSLQPQSVTERHLATVTESLLSNNQGNLLAAGGLNLESKKQSREMTGLALKVEISLQKIFFNISSGLLNIGLLSQSSELQRIQARSKSDLLDIWPQTLENQRNAANQSLVLQNQMGAQTQTPQGFQSTVKIALEVYRQACERMLDRYGFLKNLESHNEIQTLFAYTKNLFEFDEWIKAEYSGCLSGFVMAEQNIAEIFACAEVALPMSAQINCQLLGKVQEQASKQMMMQGDYGVVEAYADDYMDEREVIFQAKEVTNLIDAISRDTKQVYNEESEAEIGMDRRGGLLLQADSRGAAQKQGQISENYLPILQDFVTKIIDKPTRMPL